MLVDSHCHLDFPELQADFPGVLERMRASGVTHAVTISTTLESFPAVRDVARGRPNLWCTAGVHPDERRDGREVSLEELIAMADDPKVVGIGETGLDYYRVEGDTQWQRERLRTHIPDPRQHHRPRAREPCPRGHGAPARNCLRGGRRRPRPHLLRALPPRGRGVSAPRLLLYCRAGFEKECAQEITAAAARMGVEGFVKARPDSGFALFTAHQEDMGAELGRHASLAHLVFPRQLVRATELIALPEADRVAPIVAAAQPLGRRFRALWIAMPDTNDAKSLATLTRPLAPHLERALKKAGIAIEDPEADERLHVFFVPERASPLVVTNVPPSSPSPMPLPRL